MKVFLVQRGVLGLIAAAGLIAIGGFALAVQAPTGPLAQGPGIHSPGVHPIPTARYFGTGGPLLGELAAVQIARTMAIGPTGRTEAHLMTYGEVVTWIGSENLYYDRSREMYVVAVSGAYEGRPGPRQQANPAPSPCNSYFAVIDATDGTVLSAGCGGPSAWPERLPTVFAK
jgi:hypothetical protein